MLRRSFRLARLLAVAIATANSVGCSPSALGVRAFDRAGKEFACPTDKIGVLARSDIDPGLFDVEACGQRARYKCLGGQVPGCIREPDPAHWDSDPALCINHGATTSKPAGCFEPAHADPDRPVYDEDHLI